MHRTSAVVIALVFVSLGAASAEAQTPLFRILGEQVPPGGGRVMRAADVDLDGDVDLVTTTHALLNDGAGLFSYGPTLPLLSLALDPPAMALGDLNADGLPELVAAAYPWTGIALNGGAGTFGAFTPIAVGTGAAYVNAQAIALGDIDADGDLDVCVTSMGWGTWAFHGAFALQPRLFLNNGAGALTEATATRLPVMSVFGDTAELADFDGDGDLDLFLSRATASANPTNPGGAYSLLLLNNGAGFFAAPAAVPGPLTPANAAIGDLNGDGLPDVVYSPVEPPASSPTTSSGVVLTLGGATFGPFVSTPLPAARVLARDLNGDGLAEIIRSSASGVTVHAVAPNGVIGPSTQALALSSTATVARDLDGDGDVDFCVDGGNRKTLVFNDATGTLVPIEGHLRVPQSSGVRVAGDVDGDGDVDLAWTPSTAAPAVQVALNDGRGNLGPGAFCPGGCLLGTTQSGIMPLDFDGDGRLDLYAGWVYSAGTPVTGTDTIYWNNGVGWTPVATLSQPGSTSTVLEGDLDGDSDRDLVVIRYSPATGAGVGPATNWVIFNLGGASFSAPVALPAALAGVGGALFDADGDGDRDVAEVVATAGGATVVLWLNNGAGAFTQAPAAIAVSSYALFAGDLDLDGDVDLVSGAQTFLNSGTGSFAPGPALPAGTFAGDLFDADQDGDMDVLQLGNVAGAPTAWILRNVGGTFPTSEVVASAWGFGPHADFDRDGDQDLIGPGLVLYTNTTRQIARGAIVRPGQNAVVNVFGPPGASWMLFASQGPASLAVPPWGTVLIDPSTAFLVSFGVFTPAGTSTFTTLVPNTPAVIGMSAHLQAGLPLQQRLTNLDVLTVLGL